MASTTFRNLLAIQICFLMSTLPGECSRTVWSELMSSGKTAFHQGNLEKCRTLLGAACREAEQDKDADAEAQSLLFLARTYEEESNWTFAETLLRKASASLKGLDAESETVLAVSNELERVLLKQGVSITKPKSSTENSKEVENENQPLNAAISAFKSHNYKKAETLFQSILEQTKNSNVSESSTDLVCIDYLYQIYKNTNQPAKSEKQIKNALDDIKSRRGSAFAYSNVAAECFLYLGVLAETQGRHEEAEVLASKGLEMYKLILKGSYKRAMESLINTWEANDKSLEAKWLKIQFNASVPSARRAQNRNDNALERGSNKQEEEFQGSNSDNLKNSLKISAHNGWWTRTSKGWSPVVGVRIENPKEQDLSDTLIKLQAEFHDKEEQKIHYVQQKICEKFVPGGGIVVKFKCPVSFDLGFDDTRWPRIKYEVLSKVYTTQNPEIESICSGKISRQILSEEEGISLLKN